MQETVTEKYYKDNFKEMGEKFVFTDGRKIVRRQIDGSLWVASKPSAGMNCVRRTVRSLTRTEAKNLGLA